VEGNTANMCYWASNDNLISWNVFAGANCNQASFSHTPATAGTYFYHVRNSDPCGYCWDNGRTCGPSSIVQVNVIAPPAAPTVFNISGGGVYCNAPLNIGLVNSQVGVNYQLRLNGVDLGSPVAGTGTALSFGSFTAAGNYTVVATLVSGVCTVTANMNGPVSITHAPLGISSVQGADFCQSSVTLHAEACGDGTIYWYANPGDCQHIGVGPSYTTPWLTNTTTYYSAVVSNTTVEGSLATSLDGTFYGLSGQMFEVGATGGKQVEIKAIKVRPYYNNSSRTIRVYYRIQSLPTGTYPAGLVNTNWTMVYDGTHSGPSGALSNWINLTDRIVIPAGCTYSIYVFYPIDYRGNATAANNASNADITIYGIGLGGADSGTEFNMEAGGARGFRGELQYDTRVVTAAEPVVATANITIPAVPVVEADEAAICLPGTTDLVANGLAPGGKVADLVAPTPITPGTTHNGVANTFTVEFWAKPNRTRATTLETNAGISGNLGDDSKSFATAPQYGGVTNAGMGISVGTNGISVYEHGDGYFPSVLVQDMPINDWVHVAVVYTNKTPSLYVNGNFVRTGMTSTRANIYPSSQIGHIYGYYLGLIDNMRIWNVALTPAQIKNNMFLEVSNVGAGLVEHRDFNNLTTDANYFTYTWQTGPSLPAPSLNETQTTGTINAAGTYNYVVSASVNGCNSPNSTNVNLVVDAPSTAPTAATGGGNYCHGNQVTLTQTGGALGSSASYNWYTGSCNGTLVGTGASITVTPTGTTDYYVNAVGACPTTACASTTVTLPTAGTTLSQHNESATCPVSGNNYIYFYHSSGRFLGAINPNGHNLGNVTMTSYVPVAPLDMPSCTNPSADWITAVMGRHWVINTQNPVVGGLDPAVALPFSIAAGLEYNQLVLVANNNANLNDDLMTGIGGLKLSKYSGPTNVDNSVLNNCPDAGGSGGTTLYPQLANGSVNTILPGFDPSANYVIFGIDGFSEFWLHGSQNSSPLPVEISHTSISCDKINQMVRLNWSTQSETNTLKFEVEKTTDYSNWILVGEKTAAGNSSAVIHYTLYDEVVPQVVYYRLKQVDQNGSFVYYPLGSSDCSEFGELMVYPNPTRGQVTLRYEAQTNDEHAAIELVDMYGKLVNRQLVGVVTGTNEFVIELSQYANATYFVHIRTTQGTIKPVKIVKMN
jgi:hypothetical protein